MVKPTTLMSVHNIIFFVPLSCVSFLMRSRTNFCPAFHSAQNFRPVRCIVSAFSPLAELSAAAVPGRSAVGTLERHARPGSSKEEVFRCEVSSPINGAELLPQALALHVVDVLIAVGGVNDLGTGINKGINLFAFQSLYRSFHCLIAHVVAELGDIHAERTVLDSGDSGGIAVKAAHDGIGIHLLSINAEKLHFP